MVVTVLHRLGLTARWATTFGAHEVWATAESSGVDPIDITHAFDHVNRPIFLDAGHTNEAGARIEAAAILPYLLPHLPPHAPETEEPG
jgi:hypothetical protein